MARIEHYDDPDAPAPNALVPAASAIVANEQGEILLQRRRDNELWALPGGAMDFGETIAETAIREVREETGITITVTGIVGIYSDPRHLIEYTDGEVRQQFNICFHGQPQGGTLQASDESTDVRWFAPAELDELPIHHTTRLRLQHFLDQRDKPYIG